MKQKRVLLLLLAAGILAAGWMLSIRTASGVEIEQTQEALVTEADALASKELYVRAIPKYEEALTYETDSNTAIQAKLLQAYYDYGSMDSYTDLVEDRIAAGTAAKEEYLNVAQYCIDKSHLEEGISYLLQGMENLGAEDAAALEEVYEANRYTYKIKSTDYETILPSSSGDHMPAFNGEKWGYVDSTGKLVISCQYDYATYFNNSGIAVVQQDGTYYCITSSGAKYGVDETGLDDVLGISNSYIVAKKGDTYSYYNYDFEYVGAGHDYEDATINANSVAAVQKDGKWGIITDSGEQVTDYIYDDVVVNSLGKAFSGSQAMLCKDGLWYLVDSAGNQVTQTGYADAKAPELPGGYIAVANEQGLWGYIDRSGNLVIDYQYTDALSFSQHLGAVYYAGSWGYISEKNELVIDEQLEWAQPFHGGTAQVGLLGSTGLITLEYTD